MHQLLQQFTYGTHTFIGVHTYVFTYVRLHRCARFCVCADINISLSLNEITFYLMVTLVPHNQCCKAQCVRTLSYTLLLLFDARCQSLSRLSLCETSSLFMLLSFSHAREQIRLSCALFVLANFQSQKLCSLAICMSVCVMYVCTYVCAQQNHDYRVGVCVCERVFEGIVRFAVDFVNFCHSIASTSTSARALALASTLASL